MTTTRDILIDTATELFLGRNFGAVGTTELCKSAGVNKGTLYHYFPSKSDLLAAAIERYATSFGQAFRDIADSDAAPEEKLRQLFDVPARANRDWKVRHGFAQGCLVGNMSLELGAVDIPVREAIKHALTTWKAPVRDILHQLIETGSLARIDCDKGADVVIGLIQGGLLLAKAQNDPSHITLLAPGALSHLNSLKP
ncbi:hypothetical protein ACP90_07875 [Labrenzia sp. CP4]|jgi:TetR/AcrR family transcriptional repressor of nem operon|uniref:TetR/AcrR family transcriptional regulator n=1 Tax=Stappiaceae TaxID=2821832 RepID=UPI0003B7EC36|nr:MULTISPECIES: TetR/AcrR family transcriptional regulator [Stappiaceae]MEC9419960.1 TetR/AcrR family transcriptional regulator [Pseudomonadota bacterium]AMN52360.1 hypothetical protein ACP90_07875 [Labrenzia sp. CP4]ERP98483.1 hypothetical protein Q669_19455 [Labrenzia sp. C1B10]ERP99988.1 hypothetical protein Q675_10530 [Labrenzia sp. C1B70]MEC9472762.1 TetR/AcrR family transcriptional regulator [Pseudomonadota bacterium]